MEYCVKIFYFIEADSEEDAKQKLKTECENNPHVNGGIICIDGNDFDYKYENGDLTRW